MHERYEQQQMMASMENGQGMAIDVPKALKFRDSASKKSSNGRVEQDAKIASNRRM